MLHWFENWFNNRKLNRKLQIFYLLCVLLPLIITDSLIVYSLTREETERQKLSMQNAADAVRYNISSLVDQANGVANNIYINRYIYEYLDEDYKTPYDYMKAYQDLQKASLFRTNTGGSDMRVTLFADNPSILNGGMFGQVSKIQESAWYPYLQESERDSVLYIGFNADNSPFYNQKRKVYFVKKLDYYKYDNRERYVRIEVDYGTLVNQLEEMRNESEIYVCKGEEILFSNAGHNTPTKEFSIFDKQESVGCEVEFTYYSCPMRILVLKTPTSFWMFAKRHIYGIILLVLINVVLPWIFSVYIYNSLTRRMLIMAEAFNSVNEEELTEIQNITGKDEIAMLMQRYNEMARRTNELIQTVYKGTIREQEFEISRKNAELLALHSQINPHFMFNTLESIRMHSILRKEYETADMVEKLAVMERQIVNWNEDVIEIQKEMDFVKAYLSLQKYRFGDKLSYEIEMDDECRRIRIPKLSIVTFVENACVHGIENKTTHGWIFVRAYLEDHILNLEIEDTGDGIEEEEVEQLLYDMEHADIDLIKEKRRVGVINACLRLKMVMGDQVSYQITSEKEIGTMVNIRIPLMRRETEETKDA